MSLTTEEFAAFWQSAKIKSGKVSQELIELLDKELA